ncbi:hypothetical protein ERO13_A13G012500v2 [Gossypium hirsutum]|nr:hypothetical protein ERO13_A13G012500v2 [Gossypium hirsutum]TYG84937.1 hypothetical protein ES288_A13G012400v1 [Gossypium darwinii]
MVETRKCCVLGNLVTAPLVEKFWQRECEMSLVDYASSSDDDVSDSEHEPPQQRHEPPPAPPPRRPSSPPKTLESGSSAVQKPETLEKLPDASMLLNSPTVPLTSGNDHASVVAAAMADNLSRKRDSKGMMGSGSNNSTPPLPRAKLPRATLPHSKSVPDTGGVMWSLKISVSYSSTDMSSHSPKDLKISNSLFPPRGIAFYSS